MGRFSGQILNHEMKVKKLIETDGLMEAEIIKSKLNSFQIPCMLKFETTGRLFGITMDGLGKVQVMVPEKFYLEAKEIIHTDT